MLEKGKKEQNKSGAFNSFYIFFFLYIVCSEVKCRQRVYVSNQQPVWQEPQAFDLLIETDPRCCG